ncbi:unnamed protein product [Malus baccata var. baccata]
MRWFSELSAKSIDCFESLADLFTNTYVKRFRAKLVEVEKSDDKLAIMAFKQGFYVHFSLSQKLNKRKYDCATLIECFNMVDDLIDWNDKTKRTVADADYAKNADQRKNDRDTPPHSPR